MNEHTTCLDVTVDGEERIPPELEELDQSLRCKICREYCVNAVSISEKECGHTFCSECVRNHFRVQLTTGTVRKAACPECRCPVPRADAALTPNRAIQMAVPNYTEFLNHYKQQQQQLPSPPPRQQQEYLTSATSSETKENDAPPTTTTATTKSRRSTRRAVSDAASPIYKDNDDDDNNVEEEVQVLDAVQRRPRFIYTRLKKKDLQELCANEGISTMGNEEDLKARHRSFLLLWNAEVDAPNPKSAQQLIHIFNQRDEAQRQEANNLSVKRQSQHIEKLKASRAQLALKTDVETDASISSTSRGSVSSGDAKFDLTLNVGFDNLISQAKKKMMAQKERGFSKVLSIPDSTSSETGQTKASTRVVEGHHPPTAQAVTPSTTVANKPTTLGNLTTNKLSLGPHPEVEYAGRTTPKTTASKQPPPNPYTKSIRAPPSNSAAVGRRASTGSSTSVHAAITVRTSINNRKRSRTDNPVGTTPPTNTTTSESHRRKHRSICGPWTCSVCTFYNEVRTYTTATCEMCSGRRGSTTPPPSATSSVSATAGLL